MLAYTIHTERIEPMNDPTITDFFATLADAKERVDRRRAEIEKLQAEIERLNTTINDASLGIEFTLQQRFSGNLDEWDQVTRIQLTNIMNGLDEAFNQ